ncbi:MAG: hypothetical protein RL094_435 [Candidatus Parcubacteria bacterium]|jgi:prolyl-tRNA synthetase
MRQSQLFTKTRREAPKDEVAKNAQLLIRAGYIHKEMAGVYAFLPLGLRVLKNIEHIIREEMNAIGGQQVSLTALQDKNLWEKTDRWDDAKIDNWFKTKLKNGSETGLGITHEEPLTNIMSEYVSSYRDLPAYVYQFQTKFRNETRAKSGIMRGREFLMKDLYSFSATEEQHAEFYQKAKAAYVRIFDKVGLGESTYVTFADGGIFSKYSEEFQTVSEAGEDLIYVDVQKGIAVNKEVLNDEVLAELGLKREDLIEKKSIETGNIFNLGTRFAEQLGLQFKNEAGELKHAIMGCYGIGLSRLMGTVVETLSDEKGIVWPINIAPFKAHIILVSSSEESKARAEEAYKVLGEQLDGVLYDDRDARAGEKFADADLIGLPYQILIGDKNQKDGNDNWLCEVKNRKTGEVQHVVLADIASAIK